MDENYFKERYKEQRALPLENFEMPINYETESRQDVNSRSAQADSDRDESSSTSTKEYPHPSQNFENYGYQITKSKNRTNLFMKYEVDQPKSKRICEENLSNFQCLVDGSLRNAEIDAKLRGDHCECAEAFSDGNNGEIENCENLESFQHAIAKEAQNEKAFKVVGDCDDQHSYTYRNDLNHLELGYLTEFDDEEIQSLSALAADPRDDRYTTTSEQWHLKNNSNKTCEAIHAELNGNRYDLKEERESAPPLSIQAIECTRDNNNQQLHQVLCEGINMGQDNSKNANDRRKKYKSVQMESHRVIPAITVADYSNSSSNDGNIRKDIVMNKSIGNLITDSEVFYDSDAFETDHVASETVADNEQVFETCENSDDRVAYINESLDNDRSDGDFNSFFEIPPTVTNNSTDLHPSVKNSHVSAHHSNTTETMNYENANSSSTISSTVKHTDSPDSGIEILDDHRTNHSLDTGDKHLHLNRDESFTRGCSTDCDENSLLQSDSEDQNHYHQNRSELSESKLKKESSILIDSISLPDVVVESTTNTGGMGNSYSVQIFEQDHHHFPSNKVKDPSYNETQDLLNQEARYRIQLEDAKKIIINTQAKVDELQAKIDNLENEISIKTWNVDRLQGELQAANKEDACIRRRLNLLQDELVNIKQKYSENEYELNRKYDDLKTKHHELVDNYRHTQNLANALQSQLSFLESDIDRSRHEKQKLNEEKETEVRKLQEALQQSQEKNKMLEDKWHKEFETLRTQHADREDHLMMDCEWKLREMQKNCKDKVEAAEKEKHEAIVQANEISSRAAEELEHVSHLLPLEAETKQLRGLTAEQRESLISMSSRIAEIEADLEAANKQLEQEIENVRKIQMHCDNALSDKDRQMLQRIEEARGLVAVEWENRLLEEMTRLKHEFEMVHMEERREALYKLQQEHIDDIKVLSCRYNANEEELRSEIAKLSEMLEEKSNNLSELKEQTDTKILQTRLHLERTYSDYQIAMNREIEKRENLEEQLKAEFEAEKLDIEEKFIERLNHVKEEFARELANRTEDMAQKHRKQCGKLPLTYGKKHLSKMGSSSFTSEQQYEKLIAEKAEALQLMENRHRILLEEADNRIKELEIQHQRDVKEMKINFSIERTTLESRDLQNSQEIEQLHRKCRCLTNLFEEMRMRYERREPRQEDLREIAELRERCESQERDIHELTARLRAIQMEKEENGMNSTSTLGKSKTAALRKPSPKIIPSNCDIIYEENEEQASPHKEISETIDTIADEYLNDDDN